MFANVLMRAILLLMLVCGSPRADAIACFKVGVVKAAKNNTCVRPHRYRAGARVCIK